MIVVTCLHRFGCLNPWFTAIVRRGNLPAVNRISIIIPVLNESAALAMQLPALQWCRQKGHELIIVDGGSTDDSVVHCEGRVDKLIESSAGRARQMNAGSAQAVNNILLFLHIDTQLPDDADQLIIQGLDSAERCWGRFDVRLSGKQLAFRVIETLMNWRSRLTGIATGDQAIFVKRDVFVAAGGYADVPLMEDILLSKMLKKYSRPLSLEQRVVSASRRWEQHGIAKTVWLMWRLRLAFFLGADPAELHRQYYLQPGSQRRTQQCQQTSPADNGSESNQAPK